MLIERYHSLDALRAFALLLGVVFHSALSYVLPPGVWAVGSKEPSAVLGWFVYYTHSFRMELFFLLAGFFASLVVARRGPAAFLRDRARRILLVFVVTLYPMKLALAALWIVGGLHTGWLQLPPEVAARPWWQLMLGAVTLESWRNFQLTHLWFLYYLSIIVALFMTVRWLVMLARDRLGLNRGTFTKALGPLLSSPLLPLVMAGVMTPLIAMMRAPGVDTPDQGLAWHWAVLALYGSYFTMGWFFYHHGGLLEVAARGWKSLLLLGIVISQFASIGAAAQYGKDAWTLEHAVLLKWGTALGTSLTMAFSVLGWIGCFVRFFSQSSARVRYLADASYWIYIVHLPVVVGLQVALARWALPWWIQLPLLNCAAFAVLVASYHAFVRFTWIGGWLNGRRAAWNVPGAPQEHGLPRVG